MSPDRAADQRRSLNRRSFLARSAAVTAALAGGTLVTTAPTAAAIPVATAAPDRTPDALRTITTLYRSRRATVRPEALADPTEATIAELAYLYSRRELTPVDVVQAHLDRISAFDGTYRAFNLVLAEQALAAARAAGRQTTALSAVPMAVKDNYYTAGVPTTASSIVFADFVPAYDATSVARLRAAGAVVMGKTQMGPLATTRATLPNGTVTTVNAWTPQDPSVNPGGSSTGSATATAGRMVTVGIGTQTGGSITEPSRVQNLTGLKATMGRTSVYGVIPLSYTRDHSGPLARSALDAAIMLSAMAGPDPRDPRTLGLPAAGDLVGAAIPNYRGRTLTTPVPVRIGVLPGYTTGTEGALRQAFLDTMAGVAGVTMVDVELPAEWDLLTGTFNAGRLPERSQPFLPYLKDDLGQFGVSLLSWLQGLFLSGDEWLTAQRAKHVLLQRVLDGMLSECDVVVQTAPAPFDLLGLPLLALPVGFRTSSSGELPAGVTLGAGPYEEDRLLHVAAAYQALTSTHLRRPADPVATLARSRTAAPTVLSLTPEEVAATTA